MKNKKLDANQRPTKVGKELDFASREAYNLLRTNISFAFPDQKGARHWRIQLMSQRGKEYDVNKSRIFAGRIGQACVAD